MPNNRREKNIAILLIIASTAAFCCMNIFVRLSAGSVSTFEQSFFRNIVALGVSAFMLKRRGIEAFPQKPYRIHVFIRSLFGFVGVLFLFYANAHATQADISIISRTTPVFVTVFSAVFLKDKLPKIQIPVIALCLLGAAIAIRPSFNSDSLPLFLTLCTSIMAGANYVIIAYCKGRVDPLTIIFDFSLMSVLGAGILMIPDFVVPDAKTLVLLLMVGVCGSLGQVFLTFGYQHAPAAELSIYDYSGIIFSSLLGFFVLGETLNAYTITAGILIFAAGLISYLYNNRRQ